MTARSLIDSFITQNALPESFASLAREFYVPLAERIHTGISQDKIRVLGISGAQGSGKSTLAAFIGAYLAERGLNVAILSLDDFYLGKSERMHLAAEVHPLLATRGVPGTHDVKRAIDTIRRLRDQKSGGLTYIPRFDKASDDRAPESDYGVVEGAVDLIVFEGWCLGIVPQMQVALVEPVNDLEREADAEGVWRSHVNQALASRYPALWELVDYLVWLRIPDFDSVYRWRREQENKLRAEAGSGAGIMNDNELAHFVQHYERITRHSLETLGDRADAVLMLNEQHGVDALRYPV